ncbi:hypothetical protein [Halalkalibacter krulwichiae]|uniref:Uncharacterized protein n=1 Tax=Halalkalibacter krulwichiae TaxID=199441 RepID=A0A1X9MBT9_9BACI|nr:hypothetical protein [Halalkalibacter krulwichiae]ARK29041.1 hypothetical protein BkAM31D_03805 [Halalkalibacter krulwichiae]
MSREKKTAIDVIEAIEYMDNEERWKLIHELYFKYFNKEGHDYQPLDLDY